MTHPLDQLWASVREFHHAFRHPAPPTPTLIPLERAAKRATWTEEECQELRDAQTIVDQADAAIDQIYFAIGTLVELGVRPGKLFDIVHGANMNKLHLVDGVPTAVYHPDGKTKKPEGWVAPEPLLAHEVDRQARVHHALSRATMP